MRFAPDSYWRGEVHRVFDRAASLARLLEEAAAAGAEQVILVSASPEPARPARAWTAPRLDPMGALSEHAASMESAALRDAVRARPASLPRRLRIRPCTTRSARSTCAGAYRRAVRSSHSLAELMERGYEDAYRRVHRAGRRALRRAPAIESECRRGQQRVIEEERRDAEMQPGKGAGIHHEARDRQREITDSQDFAP